jgi:hypothetical protein
VNPSTDPTIMRIELTVTRLVRTHAELPPARRPGFTKATAASARAPIAGAAVGAPPVRRGGQSGQLSC